VEDSRDLRALRKGKKGEGTMVLLGEELRRKTGVRGDEYHEFDLGLELL
jgi:hypothetical protein